MACVRVADGWRRFLGDLKDSKLWVIKLTYFFFMAAMVMPWSQISIHQKQLGLSTYDTGTFGTALAVVHIFLPSWASFLADKMGNFKVPMSITTVMAGVNILLFTVVPSAVPDGLTHTTGGNNTTLIGRDIMATAGHSFIGNSSASTPAIVPDPGRLSVTYWTYLFLRTSYGSLTGTGYTLFDGAVMAFVQAQGVDYGFQRAWGTLAVLCTSYVCGLLVQHTGDINVIFYVCGGLYAVTAALMMLLNMNFKLPAQSLTREIFSHLRNPEIALLFSAVLSAGVFMSYLETFTYRYLSTLGASPVLLSLTVTVGAPSDLVLTLAASFLVRLMGHAALVTLGLFTFSLRMFGYSVLVNPWWSLPLEVLDSLSTGLFINTVIMYCTVLFSSKTITSSRGIFTALSFGFGKLVGNLVGTETREVLGDQATFRVFGGTALMCAVLYIAAYHVHSKRTSGTTSSDTRQECGTNNEAFEETDEKQGYRNYGKSSDVNQEL